MGTSVDVLIPASAQSLVAPVRTLFQDWQRALTRFSPDSELSRLNAAAGSSVPVSPLLFGVVAAALDASAETDGIFDPTLLGELVGLGYDRTFEEVRSRGPIARPPLATPEGLKGRLRGAGWRGVRLDPERRTIFLPEEVGLDLGGIAKGMAVDAAIELLADSGCDAAAVDAGGDLAVLGAPDQGGWPIRIELPGGDRTVTIDGGALATSGISRRHWVVGGRQVHHILDPRTGTPATGGLWSVTVAAATCQAAEVAATAAFVLGSVDGTRWLTEHGIDGLLVFADGRQIDAGPWAGGSPVRGPVASEAAR